MTFKYTLSVPYFELETLLSFSLKRFQLTEEAKLENQIKYYQRNEKDSSRLLFWEMDNDVEKQRDLFYTKRPNPDNSYILFKKSLSGSTLFFAEEEALIIANKIGTNSFILMRNNQRLAVFIKLDSFWYWLPLNEFSKLPKFQSQLLSFSEIDQRDQFFTPLLKT